MPTNTYVALDKKTTTGSVSSVEFTGISAAYTDLVLVMEYSLSAANDSVFMRFNSDTATNYSDTVISGNGTSATSGRDTSSSAGIRISANNTAQGSGTRQTNIISIMNYANTTTFKTVLSRYSSVGGAEAFVGLWRKTPEAINTITLRFAGGANFETGATFSLYGIAAQPAVSAKATGGTITNDIQYTYHMFTSSGTFTPTQSLTCDYLVVAGGGATWYDGGTDRAWVAGAGAGGYRYFTSQSVVSSTAYTVTIGAGGSRGTSPTKGSNSSFIGGAISTSSTGGAQTHTENAAGINYNGGSSSGGVGGPGGAVTYTGNEGGYTPVEGYSGGAGASGFGGGGGGSSGNGASGATGNSAAGGAGTSNSISGTSVTYAAGGRGGNAGFLNASANTGNGGGSGGSGGSGIVIIRYAN
jgi:hypothetical protein